MHKLKTCQEKNDGLLNKHSVDALKDSNKKNQREENHSMWMLRKFKNKI